MKELLCVITYESIFLLDMTEILAGDDWDTKCAPPSPPLKKWIKLDGTNLPSGMGCLKLDNTLYMFGGEFLEVDAGKDGYILDYGTGRCSKDVMKLDLCDLDSSPTRVGELEGPKYNPVVFEFGGKIYILCGESFGLPGTFEVWDPISKESSSLPLPTSKQNLYGFPVYGSYLNERGIVVNANERQVFFDVENGTWLTWPGEVRIDCAESKYVLSDWCCERQPRQSSYVLPQSESARLYGVPAPGHDDAVVDTCSGELYLYLLPRSPDECCLCQTFDFLDNYRRKIKAGFYLYVNVGMAMLAGSREHGKESGYVCAVVPCHPCPPAKKYSLLVYAFRVEKLSYERPKLTEETQRRMVSVSDLFSLVSLRIKVYEFDFNVPARYGHYPYDLVGAYIWTLPEAPCPRKKGGGYRRRR